MPWHGSRCLFWLSSSESKSLRGTKPEAYPLCTGNKGESTLWVQWREGASWTLTGPLSSKEIIQIHAIKLHWNIDKSSVLCLPISIFSKLLNKSDYLFDPIISTGRYWWFCSFWDPEIMEGIRVISYFLIMLHYYLFMKLFRQSKY